MVTTLKVVHQQEITMRYFACTLLLLCVTTISSHAQSKNDKKNNIILPANQRSWKTEVEPVNYLGMEAYGNTGNLHKSEKTRLWSANSFAWELYYIASIPHYNWISFGAGLEVGGSVGVNNLGTVFDRTLDESLYFVFQAYLNISPWFTLHFNSEGRMQLRGRYTANFNNPVNDNFGHFLLTELRLGLFIPGNEVNLESSTIDKFWIDSPSLEFLYYIQFHKNVAFRWFSKFYVNNGLFYNSGIRPGQSVPMEHYARLDFILGGGITLWTRVQWNIYNSDFNDRAFFPTSNPFDIQLRAGMILIIDFNKKQEKSI